MLQNMRENMKGTVAFIIVGFLAFILAASLVNLTESNSGSHYRDVASVNGEPITERQLQLAIFQERQRLEVQYAQFSNNLPADFFSDENLRGPVLQGLIQRSALIQKAQDGKMVISDAELDKFITQMPQFQLDGRFNPDLYSQAIRNRGETSADFRSQLHNDLVSSQLSGSLASTGFVTDKELKQMVALTQQTRDFSWVSLPLTDLPEKMAVSDEEVQAYYDANKQNYLTEEQVSIEYIELKASDIVPTVEIAAESVQQQYDDEINRHQATTEREAAHIMIEGDDEAAQSKLKEVQEKLSAGADFAEIAKEYSDDFGSKESGGNLGIVTNESFPDQFIEALSVMTDGEVSEPVKIDNATHIIKLVKLTENTPPTFEESKARIEAELKKIQAEEIFVEKLNALSDISYNADSLVDVAKELSLTAKQTGLFSRTNSNNEAVLANHQVVSAAFSDRVLQQKYTSDVLELSPNNAVVINLIKHEPVRTLSIDEKRDDIVAELKLSKAKEQLAAQAEKLQTALNAGESLASLAEENELELKTETNARRQGNGLAPELSEHVFSMARPAVDTAVSSTLYLSNNDYAIVSLMAVNDAEFDKLSAEEQRAARLSYERASSIEEYNAWQSVLVEKADVGIVGEGS